MAELAEVIDLTERLPTSEEIDSAAEAVTVIAQSLTNSGALKIYGENNENISLAPAISNLIIEILGIVSRGDMVTFVPYSARLTTQQAADILNFPRSYLIKLLKEGKISNESGGTHRRVNLQSLLEFKHENDKNREESLLKFAHNGQLAESEADSMSDEE